MLFSWRSAACVKTIRLLSFPSLNVACVLAGSDLSCTETDGINAVNLSLVLGIGKAKHWRLPSFDPDSCSIPFLFQTLPIKRSPPSPPR